MFIFHLNYIHDLFNLLYDETCCSFVHDKLIWPHEETQYLQELLFVLSSHGDSRCKKITLTFQEYQYMMLKHAELTSLMMKKTKSNDVALLFKEQYVMYKILFW